jgi:hypothetical protein
MSLGCKGLPETDALAFYEHSQFMNDKSFKTLNPVASIIYVFQLYMMPLESSVSDATIWFNLKLSIMLLE